MICHVLRGKDFVMKKALMTTVLLALTLTVMAQDADTVIETYKRNFARSSLGTKLELLKEASSYSNINMGPLYDTALLFVLDNAPILSNDAILREMMLFSVEMVKKYQYKPSAGSVWKLFLTFRDSSIRVPILQALAVIGMDNQEVIASMNNFLNTQNTLFRAGEVIDMQVMDAMLFALGNIGNKDSFAPIFTAYSLGYSDAITKRAQSAIDSLGFDVGVMLNEIISRNQPVEKLAALKIGLQLTTLPKEKRGELAENALSVGTSSKSDIQLDQNALTELRLYAARELTNLKWQSASSVAIQHFQDFQNQYTRNRIPKSYFLEAIALLGAVSTTEAAQTLALYLQYINTQMEQGKAPDEQITLAVINNLGLLGDKISFDQLLYVSYLQYSDTIKKAAQDALQKLRW